RPAGVAHREEHAALLERQLSLDAGQASFEQVVDLGAKAPGDHPEHARRGLALPVLDLVQKRPAEVGAAHAGETHSALMAHTANAIAERFVLRWHCKELLYK